MKVTYNEFIDLLSGPEHRAGAKAISMYVVVRVKMRKTNNPYASKIILKGEVVSGMVQFNYDNNVKEQSIREGGSGNFKEGTSWHHVAMRDNGKLSPFSFHKAKGEINYLRFRKQGSFHTSYFDEDGREYNYEDLAPFIIVSNYENQGLDTPVEFKIYKFASIIYIKIDGQTYDLIHPQEFHLEDTKEKPKRQAVAKV